MIGSGYWRVIMFVPILISASQSILLFKFFKYETPIYSITVKNDENEAKLLLSNH